VPTKAAVKIAIEDTKGLSQADYSHAIETVDTLEPRTQNKEWLLKRTEEYCKDRALVNSVMTAITVIDGSNTKLSKNAIPSMLQEALNVSFDKTIGHDYFDDADRRYDFYHLKEDRLPFDLEMFNKITCGGLPSKTLSAVLAGCVHPATKVKIRIRRK
jgi:hypothetical protein